MTIAPFQPSTTSSFVEQNFWDTFLSNELASFSEENTPSVNGYTLDKKLDALHRTLETTPPDISQTWFYWVNHFFINEKLMKKEIVLKLNQIYPWYRNQTRTDKSKMLELTRLLKGIDNGENFRLKRKIIKLTDKNIINGLNQCYEYQNAHPDIKLRVSDLSKISSINGDTFKRRLGKITEEKFKQRHSAELRNLLKKVKAVTGPWGIPEWDWYFLSKPEVEWLLGEENE